MDDKNRGLYHKYNVSRVDGKQLKGVCVVLESGDPVAWHALLVWADSMEKRGYRLVAQNVRSIVSTEQAAAVMEKIK